MHPDSVLLLAAVFGAGLAIGAYLGHLAAAGRTRRLGEQSRQAARDAMAAVFADVSAQALERTGRQFLDLATAAVREVSARTVGELDARREAVDRLVDPVREALSRLETQVRGLETARAQAYAALTEQVATTGRSTEELRRQTAALATALRRPEARGRWGELQLRRVVELAGMSARCDFEEQPTVGAGDTAGRPDLVVHLAGGRVVVVDAKVSLAAYLEAAEAEDSAVREERLRAHARHVRAHVDSLAAKAYWERLAGSPEFVVLFLPGEAFLAPALELDRTLLEDAARQRVVLATPTTLVALLRTVAWGWHQEQLTEHADAILRTGRELQGRLAVLVGHLDRLGRSLGTAVGAFNATVGSLESRVLPTARRLADLGGAEDQRLAGPGLVGEAPRTVVAQPDG